MGENTIHVGSLGEDQQLQGVIQLHHGFKELGDVGLRQRRKLE